MSGERQQSGINRRQIYKCNSNNYGFWLIGFSQWTVHVLSQFLTKWKYINGNSHFFVEDAASETRERECPGNDKHD